MGWYKVKILPADRLFSNYIRMRDKWKCQYKFKCFGGEDFSDNKGGLDCSHFQKRGKWSVRYDPENGDAACKACHHYVENDPLGQKTLEGWKEAQLGTKRYSQLILRANTTGKRDDLLAKITVQALIKELK